MAFENFPYTNFHELNLDWIAKIAKDFLEQYTHIQDTITQGLEDLDNKAAALQALLDEWYNTHSADIANQLADALEDLNEWYNTHQNYLDQTLTDNILLFTQRADAKAAEAIATIPADYTSLSNDVFDLNRLTIIQNFPRSILTGNGYIRGNAIVDTGSDNYWQYSDLIEITADTPFSMYFYGVGLKAENVNVQNVLFYDENERPIDDIKITTTTPTTGTVYNTIHDTDSNVKYMRVCSANPELTGFRFKLCIVKKPIAIVEDFGDIYTKRINKEVLNVTKAQNGFVRPDGTYVAAANTGWYSSAELIDVSDFNRLVYSLRGTNAVSIIACYNEFGEHVESIIPPSADYAVISGIKNLTGIKYIRFCYFANIAYQDHPVCRLFNMRESCNIPLNHSVNKPYSFTNKKALFVGDSITRGFTDSATITENNYPKLFSDKTGLISLNAAVGGATLSEVTGYPHIMTQLTGQSNLAQYDYIFIAGGVNDWQLAVSPADFKAAIQQTIEYIRTNAPAAEIIVIAPINEAGVATINTPVADLEIYRIILRDVAIYNDCSFINGAYFNFPTKISETFYRTSMLPDRLHPSERGYRNYAKELATVLC